MDPELKRLLEQNLALGKENNSMLRSMRRNARFGFAFKIILWAVLLLAPLYFYQEYLAPIIGQFQPGGQRGSTSNFAFPSYADFQKLLEEYKSQ